MFFTSALQVVFKTTGGRIWNKRWGLPRLTPTRKENRKKDLNIFNQNINVLKSAAHLEPEVPVRLSRPLPQWQAARMRRRLENAQEEINIRAAGPAVAQRLLQQQQWKQQPAQQELAGPPVDPQLQQRLNQQEVTRIKQQQLRRFMQEQRQQQKQASQPQPRHQQQQQQQ